MLICKKADWKGKSVEETFKQLMKWVEAKDACAIYALGSRFYQGSGGMQQDQTKALEIWTQAAELGYYKAHCNLGDLYCQGRNLKKARGQRIDDLSMNPPHILCILSSIISYSESYSLIPSSSL